MAFWSVALQKCNEIEQARKVCGLSGLVFSRKGSGLALSVTFGDRFPLLSLCDIFPRNGGSLSSKGEPLA